MSLEPNCELKICLFIAHCFTFSSLHKNEDDSQDNQYQARADTTAPRFIPLVLLPTGLIKILVPRDMSPVQKLFGLAAIET